MLTLKLLREKPEFVIERLAVKHFDAKETVEKILKADEKRRACQREMDALLAEQKKRAAEIGAMMKSGQKEKAEEIKREVAS